MQASSINKFDVILIGHSRHRVVKFIFNTKTYLYLFLSKRKALHTTKRELHAMPSAAIAGRAYPKAAMGMAMILYDNAQYKFSLIINIVRLAV